ncbi:DotU family type IV/VI secretion system protein [Bermanella sp. R86510]|uniref:DotU family type IV/VI secretion system protein n=1 Tax=unclassified Bermanella TaxID=2627862 RepID=UPI0037CB700D
MRLIDFYIDPILEIQSLKHNTEQLEENWEAIKEHLSNLLLNCQTNAIKAGYSEKSSKDALFPVVAFLDEAILTSEWSGKSQWQTQSLQRDFFNTTNSGYEFYERLHQLNRQGDDRAVREVYLLCLSLGYKGRYYLPQDRPKIEEIRVFNLDLLLPNDANKVFEKSTLFSDGYHERDQIKAEKKSRLNLVPFFAVMPFVVVISTLVFYSLQINQGIQSIMDLVK